MIGFFQMIDLQFGMGEGTHHIILELYALGNILLTDGDYNVLTLLRTHRFDFELQIFLRLSSLFFNSS
jgi:predicted ribosome quality control (RQC) complex YloA/Tae2 family protein